MKYTLIIDGHNFLFRCLYVLPQKKNKKILSDKESKDLFVSKLSQNMNSVIREMEPLVDRCILTLDSRSWRNDIESDVDYKGTRNQEDTIDWDGFKECMDLFVKDIEKYNITVSKTGSAEADDLIFMWSTALNSKNIPVIIYTSDKDMLQLVSANNNACDTLLWSDVTRKLYVPENFSNIIKNDSTSFMESFMKGSTTVDIYDRFANLEQSIRKRKLEKIEVDNIKFIYVKILIGDKSDNISSIYSYEKNGRIYNVTEAKAEKILEKYIKHTGELNMECLFVDDALSDLAKACVEIINGAEYESVLKNIKRNINYMVLSKQVLPIEVSEKIMTDIRSLAKKMKHIDFSQVIKTDESVIKRTEKLFKDADDSDMSFIKKTEKSLF